MGKKILASTVNWTCRVFQKRKIIIGHSLLMERRSLPLWGNKVREAPVMVGNQWLECDRMGSARRDVEVGKVVLEGKNLDAGMIRF
jgi:hypothetical protein